MEENTASLMVGIFIFTLPALVLLYFKLFRKCKDYLEKDNYDTRGINTRAFLMSLSVILFAIFGAFIFAPLYYVFIILFYIKVYQNHVIERGIEKNLSINAYRTGDFTTYNEYMKEKRARK